MRVTVIGAGAAGMMASVGAAVAGHEVTVIDRNEKPGKKIYITGKGRCNLTNACPPEELMKSVVRNPRFLYSAFYSFDNSDIISFLEEEGVKTKIERGDRVFPVSDHASDVTSALKRRMDRLGVRIVLNERVTGLIMENSTLKGVATADSKRIDTDCVIVATGGMSYPTTGSDGSMFEILRKAGHTVTDLKPALVPLICDDPWMEEVRGLSLKNVAVRLMRGKKRIYGETGEMLFTGTGVSGPLVLSASSYYEPQDELIIDCKPGLDAARLDERLIRDFKEYSNRDFANSLGDLLPKSLIPPVIGLSGIDPHKKVHQITQAERNALGNTIKNIRLNVTGTGGFDEAIITRGGVSTKEIDPSTMRSKIIKGLSFAGEVIDVDALTGGFNLQIAWSTGYLAGLCAGND